LAFFRSERTSNNVISLFGAAERLLSRVMTRDSNELSQNRDYFGGSEKRTKSFGEELRFPD
jgi:hypothetical protein